MSTESLKYARFDHPEHGAFESAEDVVNHGQLTEDQKRSIIAEWKRRVAAAGAADPEATRLGSTLDLMADKLASMRT